MTDKQILADMLSELDGDMLRTALAYAKGLTAYGVDVTVPLATAVENLALCEKAEQRGYVKGVQDTAAARESILKKGIMLIKEAEERHTQEKNSWLKQIADNQLANSPMYENDMTAFMTIGEHMKARYQRGLYDGLQMAYDIISGVKDNHVV